MSRDCCCRSGSVLSTALQPTKRKCATCYGADGKGDTPAGRSNKVRCFADPEVVKANDARLARIIEEGKGKMPGYGKSLKPDEIKDMVAYIRSLAK